MKAQARSYFWWPGLDKDKEDMMGASDVCTQIKASPPPVTLHPWAWPSSPWSRLHVDFVGPVWKNVSDYG